MKLLDELLSLAKPKTQASLVESTQLFDDVDVIRIDPDRDDAHDIASKLMPSLVKIAYTYLVSDKKQHERQHGPKSDEEDAYNFAFTKEELLERLENLVGHVKDRLEEQIGNDQDINEILSKLSREFKEPLEK